MEEFTKVLETKRQLSTAYYLQTDSQIERINKEVEVFLQHYVNYQNNSTEWLLVVK